VVSKRPLLARLVVALRGHQLLLVFGRQLRSVDRQRQLGELAREGKRDLIVPVIQLPLTLLLPGVLQLGIESGSSSKARFLHRIRRDPVLIDKEISQALGERKGIRRYGHAVIPMDDALATVTVDLSNRPFLVCNTPDTIVYGIALNPSLTKEFFRALVNRGGMNLHINVAYGDNDHHVIESIFKAFGRALDQAAAVDGRISGVLSSKGAL